MSTQTVSNSKIIVGIVFIAAALMASLFIYHAKNQKQPIVVDNGKATIFPAPKAVAPFALMQTDGSDFSQKNLYHHWTLLYFGFTHCNSVCPATFEMLKRAYPELKRDYPDLQVVMVSIDPARDGKKTLANYVHGYHPDFIGASGDIANVRKLQSQLGIYADQPNGQAAEYQLQHTSSLILMNPHGQWAGMYKFGMKPAEFVRVFKASLTHANS